MVDSVLFHLRQAADLLADPADHDLTVSEETAIRRATFHVTKCAEALRNGTDQHEHPEGGA